MRFYCNQQCLVCSKIRTRSAASPCLPFGTSMKSCSVAALLLVWASSLDPTTSAPQSTAVVVEPYELGFRVAWRDTLDGHASEDYEPMTILVSELTERVRVKDYQATATKHVICVCCVAWIQKDRVWSQRRICSGLLKIEHSCAANCRCTIALQVLLPVIKALLSI